MTHDEPTRLVTDGPDQDAKRRRISRRSFFKRGGITAASAATGTLVAGCDVPWTGNDSGADAFAAGVHPPVQSAQEESATVPPTPMQPPDATTLRFFTPDEARTLDALLATILPGDANDPGAREAGVVAYIDHLLGSQPAGWAQPIYRDPPFAMPYDGDTPPDSGNYQVIWVKRDQLPRYGYQTVQTPREIYRLGLAQLNADAQSQFGKNFADLSADQQEKMVGDMADAKGKKKGFYPPDASDFFETVRQHVVEGMFSDPVYGGNVGFAGWKLVGYPGAQRAYTPDDIHTEYIFQTRGTQSILQMMPFQPGQPVSPNSILPVSGTDQQHPEHDYQG